MLFCKLLGRGTDAFYWRPLKKNNKVGYDKYVVLFEIFFQASKYYNCNKFWRSFLHLSS